MRLADRKRRSPRLPSMVLALIAAGILALTAPRARAGDFITLGGYIKSFAVAIDEADLEVFGETETQDWLWANSNRARVNLGLELASWLTVDTSYDLSLRIQDDLLFIEDPLVFFPDFPVYRFADLESRLWPDAPGEGDHAAIYQNLDRLYATVSVPYFDLFVGRQSIAWGSAHAVNPTDIISPFYYDEIDTEDPVGVDAVRLRIPAGPLGEFDAGYVAGKDFEWALSAAFLRSQFYADETDWGLLVMAFRENLMAGLDVARNIGGAGVWCETAYVWADVANNRRDGSRQFDYLRLSTGVEYNHNLGNGLYTFVEYHFNNAGAADPDDYVTNARANAAAYVDGTVYLLGRHYIIPGLSYQLNAVVVLSLESLVNLNDGSFLLAPHVEFNFAENLYLSFGGFGAYGSHPELVFPSFFSDGELLLHSEFGSYPSQYYTFLQFYY